MRVQLTIAAGIAALKRMPNVDIKTEPPWLIRLGLPQPDHNPEYK
jgi:hypothetical protein